MTDPLKIREACRGDLDALDRIERAAFEPARRASRRSLRRALESPRQLVLVAESPTELLGYAVLWRYRLTWRLYSIATRPQAQGRSVGNRLLAEALSRARAGGARGVQLEARATPELQGWYARHGFVTIARLLDYYGRGDDAVRMRLELESSETSAGIRGAKAKKWPSGEGHL